MVDNPKTLYDLRKIDADLRIKCRACGRLRMIDREWLIAELLKRRKSVDWATFVHQLRCSADGCGGRVVDVEIVPFAGREIPKPVQALLNVMKEYIAASGKSKSGDLAALQASSEASAKLHRATRRLVMWTKYGVGREE